MLDTDRLRALEADALDTERAIRAHLSQDGIGAGEQARGAAAYRHAVALRKAIGDWLETRAFRATVGGRGEL
jgi:hypothetical protein